MEYQMLWQLKFICDILNDHRKLLAWIGLVGDSTIISPFFYDGNFTGESY